MLIPVARYPSARRVVSAQVPLGHIGELLTSALARTSSASCTEEQVSGVRIQILRHDDRFRRHRARAPGWNLSVGISFLEVLEDHLKSLRLEEDGKPPRAEARGGRALARSRSTEGSTGRSASRSSAQRIPVRPILSAATAGELTLKVRTPAARLRRPAATRQRGPGWPADRSGAHRPGPAPVAAHHGLSPRPLRPSSMCLHDQQLPRSSYGPGRGLRDASGWALVSWSTAAASTLKMSMPGIGALPRPPGALTRWREWRTTRSPLPTQPLTEEP